MALGSIEFGNFRDHRKHDAQASAAAGAQESANLAAQQAWTVQPKPDGSPAERWILLDHALHIRQRLVAADVEGAERHRLGASRIEHGAIQSELVAGSGQALADHELQFGAKQADAAAAGIVDMRQVDRKSGIDQELDRLAVLGDAGLVAQG
jgi:hypothetical protein